jgi:manganese/zinc/iron transport system substrate-binding protein
MPLTRRTLLALMSAAALPLPLRAAEGPTVVATTGMIADAAQVVGGGTVRALMGPGMDPHGYRQTRSDIVAMARADLVLWHGLYLEAQMEDFLLDLSRQRKVVAVAEALPKELLRGNPDYPDRFDPHVWMAPELWSLVVAEIARALSDVAPERAADHATLAESFQGEIAALQAYAHEVLATVPPEARVLVTAHDAFGYFGAAYGFEVQGIQGLSTESEAGLARIGQLVDMLVERRVQAVFVESSVSDRSMRALIEGAAAKGHEVRIGGQLYSDAMGADGSYEGTYLGMIDHNVTLIAGALGGRVPERGRLGKLMVQA